MKLLHPALPALCEFKFTDAYLCVHCGFHIDRHRIKLTAIYITENHCPSLGEIWALTE